ncbi:dolichol kinase [Balamuthia mandrillaris]
MEGGLVGVAALQIAWRFLAVGTPPTSPLVVVVGSTSLCLWRLSGIALLLLCLLCFLLPSITAREKKRCWKHFFLLRSENEGGGANAGSSLALGVMLVPFMLAAKLWLVRDSSYDVAFFLYYLWEGMCCGLCALLLSCWVGMFGQGRHGSTRSSLRAVTALFCVLPAPILSLLITFLFPDTSFLLNFGTQCLFVMSLTTSLHYLPRCFTFAEATLLASAFTLFTSDAFIYSFSRFSLSSFLVAPFLSVNRDPIQLFLFALIVGMMICGLFVVLFLRSYLPLPPFPSPASANVKENHAKSASAAPSSLIHRKPKRKEKELSEEHKEKQPGLFSLFSDSGWFVSLAFYCIIVAVVLSLIYPWLHLMLNDNPFLWTIEWLISDDRVFALCVYWASVLVVSLLLIAFLDARFRDAVPKIIVRKYYHLLTIIMFVPGIFYQMDFLRLAFGVALSALLLIEYIRKAHIRPFGTYIHQFMHSFIDSRDLGFFFLTHIHLLLGCAIPVWFFSSPLSYPPPPTSFYRLLPFVGVLIVGIGDSLASLVGRCFGSCKWPRTKKTVEGTASAVVGVLLCSAVLLWWMDVGLFDFYQWRGLVWATTSACLLEAFTLQIDNLVLPMYFFSVLVFSL